MTRDDRISAAFIIVVLSGWIASAFLGAVHSMWAFNGLASGLMLGMMLSSSAYARICDEWEQICESRSEICDKQGELIDELQGRQK